MKNAHGIWHVMTKTHGPRMSRLCRNFGSERPGYAVLVRQCMHCRRYCHYAEHLCTSVIFESAVLSHLCTKTNVKYVSGVVFFFQSGDLSRKANFHGSHMWTVHRTQICAFASPYFQMNPACSSMTTHHPPRTRTQKHFSQNSDYSADATEKK